jgi:alpha-galactosidase/6-phospho-beta-glucosidase family protein
LDAGPGRRRVTLELSCRTHITGRVTERGFRYHLHPARPIGINGKREIALAEEYGLFFPVGDTAGAPGLIRGLRSVPIYKEFAEAIAAFCPNAWVINYTNPMTICTRTLTRVVPELKVFGCCHEVFGIQGLLARIAGQYLNIEPPARSEIRVNVLGVNHFTWIDRANYQGHDLLDLLHH